MNKKHIGGDFFDDVKEWEKSPAFRSAVEAHKEKARVALLVRQARQAADMTQTELAHKAGLTQSVVARMEAPQGRALPRLDLLSRTLAAAGYRLSLQADKRGSRLCVEF